MNRDIPDYALVVGVPAKQIGWMSEFGEQLELPIEGHGQARCSQTHDLYVLNGSELSKHPVKTSTGLK